MKYNDILFSCNTIYFSCLCRYEAEPKTPSVPLPDAPSGKFSAVSRVDSLDSNATSESDETYKAPLAMEPTSTLSPSLDSTLGNQLAVVRQPLFPDASKEVFAQAEISVRAVDVNARNRRACFAHTNSQQQKEESAITMIESHSTGRHICFTFDIVITL
jgi:hypothetical protein